MNRKAAITVNRPRAEVEQLWRTSEHRPKYVDEHETSVRFADAPGDRGTEIVVDLDISGPGGGKLGEALEKLMGTVPLAKVKDDLRRFKQYVETGEIPRSEGSPAGERVEGKFKQRPAQPLSDSEIEKVGV